jgi:thymidylate kinase
MQENNFPKAICLVGGDGTGKTAHATKIIEELRVKGKNCRYAWFGQPYLLSYPFMFLCNKLGYTKNHTLPNRIVCQEHQYYKNKALASVWPWIQLFDLSVLVLFRVCVPVWRGTTVVCDRFVHDALVELTTDVGDKELYRKRIGRLILALKPSFVFIIRLNVNAQTAFARRNDVPDERFLRVRRDNYQIISSYLKIKTFDAELSFDSVHLGIMEYLKVTC